MAANSAVSGEIPPKFELTQAVMFVLVTFKNEEDPIKNEGSRVLIRFSHYMSMGFFLYAQGQLTLQSVLVLDFMVVSSLPTKMKKIRSKLKALDC